MMLHSPPMGMPTIDEDPPDMAEIDEELLSRIEACVASKVREGKLPATATAMEQIERAAWERLMT